MKIMATALVLLFTSLVAQAEEYGASWLIYDEEYGASYDTGMLLDDEIARHVIDECNLKGIHGKNRIDFDAYNVAVDILPEIHKKFWKEKRQLTDKISAVVFSIQSFSRRAKIYDVYYELCIGEINIDDAEKQILRNVSMTLTNDQDGDDSIISELYASLNNKKRIERDESKLRVLERMNETESRTNILKKNLSVVQEYRYDIELWKL